MEQFSFFTSNGKGDAPIGLDLAKSALFEAENYREGIITKSAGRYYYHNDSWHGERKFLQALREDIDLLGDLCLELDRDSPKSVAQEEIDETDDN